MEKIWQHYKNNFGSRLGLGAFFIVMAFVWNTQGTADSFTLHEWVNILSAFLGWWLIGGAGDIIQSKVDKLEKTVAQLQKQISENPK